MIRMTVNHEASHRDKSDKQSVIDRVPAERADLARVLKKHTGIRHLVEEIYPDSAHFIFELLQNSEDGRATEVDFVLTNDCLSFEHNGRAFTKEDILGITDVGKGTKFDDEDTFDLHSRRSIAHCSEPGSHIKGLIAKERDRSALRRERGINRRQPRMRLELHRPVFIDETAVKTDLTRLRGRAPVGERLYGAAPFGTWDTQTFIAGLTHDAPVAPG